MAYYICRSVLLSHLVTRHAMFLQLQKFALRNSNPVLHQSLLLKSYTNSALPSPPPEGLSTAFVLDKYLAKAEKALKKLIYAGVIGSTGDILFAWCWNSYNKYKFIKTVEKGTRPDVKITEAELVPRPLITERLKKILVPCRNQSSYYVVCGEHGTGKTTLMRVASREVGEDKKGGIKGGCGVIYVDIPPEVSDVENFGKQFGKALNFTFEERISFTGQLMKKIFGFTNHKDSNKDPKWMRALEAFKSASAVYKKKNPYHQPPVIIYDNISRLIPIDPKILDFLQDDAKDNADNQDYITVFVCSEGSVPRRMEFRSAWSRSKSVIEIGDLSEKESMEYLTKKRKINEVEAKKLYELVGGRIVELKDVADDFLAQQSFEVIKQSIFTKVEKKFNTAQLLRKQLYHEVGKKAIKALFDSKELGFTTFMEIFNNYEDASKVLETNIFAYHPEKNTVSFQSQSVECYIREKEDIFIK